MNLLISLIDIYHSKKRNFVTKNMVIISLSALMILFSGCRAREYSFPNHETIFCADNQDSSAEQYGDFEFEVEYGQVSIKYVLTDALEIIVPENIDGNVVTEIGDSAFYQKECTDISLPSALKTIGSNAFYRCVALRSITVPAAVENIEGNPFFRCPNLADIFVEPGNVDYCDIDGVLYNAEKNVLLAYPEGRTTTVYEIPYEVTTIGDMAFGYHTQLTRVIISENVTNFPDYNLFEMSKDICFLVKPGSAAEQYAVEFGIQTEYYVSE